MRRWLLDVNVVLDFLMQRAPFAKAARGLWTAAERKEIQALVPAHGVTTVFYVANRERDAQFARQLVAELLVIGEVAPVDALVLRRALTLSWKDYEDAVCAAAAEAARCDLLVTRDPRGFRDSPVPALDPFTALALLNPPGGPEEVAERRARYTGERKPRAARRGRPRLAPRSRRASQP